MSTFFFFHSQPLLKNIKKLMGYSVFLIIQINNNFFTTLHMYESPYTCIRLIYNQSLIKSNNKNTFPPPFIPRA